MAVRMPSQSFRMSGPSSQAWKPNGRPSGLAERPVACAAAAAAAAIARNSRRVTLTVSSSEIQSSAELAGRGDVENGRVAETLAELRQIQAARKDMPVQ